MFQIDLKNRKALYEQIIDHFKELIIAGVLKPEEKVPSVRDLAKNLTINPNTIQKAYRELENLGYIYTVSGLGSFISMPSDSQSNQKRIDELKSMIRSDINELLYLQCPKQEILSVIQGTNLYQEGEERP